MKVKLSGVKKKPVNPSIYEINTAVWLRELSSKYKAKTTLENIPAAELDDLSRHGFDYVWLMGVWKRSPKGRAIAREHAGIMGDIKEALPDFSGEDIAGSPYCIKDYVVDGHFGGNKGLVALRKGLADRGIGLILDYVPNHVAPDHPWTVSHPEYFITGTEEEMAQQPDNFFQAGDHIYSKASDPFFPPWPDVLQLSLFNTGLREAMLETVLKIADKCDGIRCDMSMLVMNDIFARTWKEKAGIVPEIDFWNYIIPVLKKAHPDFIFIGESYWDTENALIEQGFDFCYDKKYYDFLKEGTVKASAHLNGMQAIQDKLLHFLENHDEPRAAALFQAERNAALAMASLTLPGAKLMHDGQLEGRKVKIPVFISRRPEEPKNDDLSAFYGKLLKILGFDAVRNGKWSSCRVSGWPDNQSCLNIMAWEWVCPSESLLIAINLSDLPAQALVRPAFEYQSGKTYQLFDVISGELYLRDGEEMSGDGLYVVLKGWGMHAFHIEL
jgi:glycosidase